MDYRTKLLGYWNWRYYLLASNSSRLMSSLQLRESQRSPQGQRFLGRLSLSGLTGRLIRCVRSFYALKRLIPAGWC